MSIKAGQIIHTGDSALIQRLQTAGPGNLNIPTNRVSELGNYQSVAVTRDTPDLTFTMESYDVTTAVEAMITKGSSSPYDMSNPLPLDIASQWLPGKNDPTDPFKVVESVALPFLVMESASYRFGLAANASQTFSFRGDSIFYNPGATIVETFSATGTSAQALLLTHPAGVYNGDLISGPRRVLGIKVGNKRLLYGVDYTEAVTGSGAFRTTTVTITAAQTAGSNNIQVVYFTSDTVDYLQSVHTAPSVKPAAIRGKDITLLVNGVALTNRWTGVQSLQIDERFTVDRDEELGSTIASAIDYTDVPAVNGNMVIRFKDPTDFNGRLGAALGAASLTEALGPQMIATTRLDVVLHHPDTGAVLKTLEITDATVTLPGYSARVNTKLDLTLNFESTSGSLKAINGAPS